MALTKITSTLITDDAVTTAKINADAVTTAKINADAVDETKIADNAVTTAKINADAVDETKIAADAVNSEQLVDGGVDDVHLATGIDATKLTGDIANARIPESAVTQHVDLTAVNQSITTLGLHMGVADNKAAYNLPNAFIDTFEDNSGTTTRTDVFNVSEYFISLTSIAGNDSYTKLLLHMDDTGLTDSSGSSQSVTLGNDVSRSSTASKFGGYSMRHVNGSSTQGKLTVGIPSLSSGSWTIDGWFRLDDVTTTQKCLIAGSSDFNFGILYSYGGSNKIDVMLGNGSSWNITGNPPSPTGTKTSWSNNTWYHVALVFDGSTYKTYIDGVLDNTFTSSANIGSVTSAYLGIWGNNVNFYEWNGYMDEWRVSQGVARWTSNFTPPVGAYGSTVANATGTLISDTQTAPAATTEVSGVMLYKDNAGTATLGTHLKIYFTANNGTNWTEAASYGTAQTFSGTTKQVKLGKTTVTSGTQVAMKAVWADQNTAKTITASGNAQHSTTQNKIGASSIHFDGTGDYITTSANITQSLTGDFTIEGWCYFSAINKTIAGSLSNWNWNSASTGDWILLVDGNGIINLSAKGVGGTSTSSSYGALNTWKHISVVRESNTTKIYLDGTLANTPSTSVTGTLSVNNIVTLGRAATNLTGAYNGYIDEFRISNTARYTANFTPSTTAFTSDANTRLLISSNTSNGSTTFADSSNAAKETQLHGWAVNY